MACHFNQRCVIFLAICGIVISLSGCLSYQYERRVAGMDIKDPGDTYPLGETTIADVLTRLGAPDEVHSFDNTDLLVYQRSLFQESGLSLGIPLLDVAAGVSVDISATGALTRYDTLVFWFNTQGMLEDIVFEKASNRPYLKTLFPD